MASSSSSPDRKAFAALSIVDEDDDTVEVSLNDDVPISSSLPKLTQIHDQNIINKSNTNNLKKTTSKLIKCTRDLCLDPFNTIIETIIFGWMRPLLKLGSEKALEPDDLYDLLPNDRSNLIYSKFIQAWQVEVNAYLEKKQHALNDSYNTASTYVTPPSLAYSLVKAFGYPFACAGLLKLVSDSCQFIGPLILNRLIRLLSDPSQPSTLGYKYVAILFLSNVVMSLCLRQYFWWCYRVGLRLRSSVVTSVYQKALTISTASLNRKSSGEITNLMSVDSTRLQELTPYLHAVWYSFFQVALAMYFLWIELGPACLAGLATIILSIPITGFVSRYMKKQQQVISAIRDERIKVTNEILGGMKVVKLQAWEPDVKQRIEAIRERELFIYRRYSIAQAGSGTLFMTIPLVVAISSLSAYVYLGNDLDVATALTSLALFEILRFPLFVFPNVINNLVEAKVSIDRVQNFLLQPDRVTITSGKLTESSITITNASVMWEKPFGRKLATQTGQNQKSIISRVKSIFSSISLLLWRLIRGIFKMVAKLVIYLYKFCRSFSTVSEEEDDTSHSRHMQISTDETIDDVENPLINSYNHFSSLFQVDEDDTVDDTNYHSEKSHTTQSGTSATLTTHEEDVTDVEMMTEPRYLRKVTDALLMESDSLIEKLEDRVKVLEMGSESVQKKIDGETNNSSLDSDHLKYEMSATNTADSHAATATATTNIAPNTTASTNVGDRWITLYHLNLQLSRGSLTALVGQVGSGKSSLISAILGDMKVVYGAIHMLGKVAYVGQKPFIQNSTLKDNILFGSPFDEDRYYETLDRCALLPDLEVLPAGDLTEIGERGINLSGGQKARVALARAYYSDADLYLLDDPIAAVDAHVGKHLFQRCILSLQRRNKGVLLVTNALQFSRYFDHILVLKDGKVVEEGSFSSLIERSGAFKDVYQTSLDNRTKGREEDGAVESKEDEEILDEPINERTLTQPAISHSTPNSRQPSPVKRKATDSATIVPFKDATMIRTESKIVVRSASSENVGGIISREDREVGDVSAHVYKMWAMAAGGVTVVVFVILLYIFVEMISVLASWWLAYWSENRLYGTTSFFLGIYIAINIGAVVFNLLRELALRLVALKASKLLFNDLVKSVMYAPMSFYDTTPLGRIINRFSKDIYTIDEQLPTTIRGYAGTLVKVAGVLIYIVFVSPFFVVALVPIALFYLVSQRYYIKTSRELSRLDSTSRSPIYALFSETLDGLSCIHAYKCEKQFAEKNNQLLDTNQKAYFLNFSANCWLAVRLEFAGALIVTFTSLLAVIGRDYYGPGSAGVDTESEYTKHNIALFAGMAGLAISLSLSVTQSLNWSVRMASDLESQMVSVERVKSYADMVQEAPHYTSSDPDSSWPTAGAIKMSNVQMRYRSGLPLVLKSVTLDIKAGEKIGIVGRTGAGKSSLFTVFLRLVELESGRVTIDDVDISTIGLNILRSRIAVIPQDPVLFSGSVRSNLDPFNTFTGILY